MAKTVADVIARRQAERAEREKQRAERSGPVAKAMAEQRAAREKRAEK